MKKTGRMFFYGPVALWKDMAPFCHVLYNVWGLTHCNYQISKSLASLALKMFTLTRSLQW